MKIRMQRDSDSWRDEVRSGVVNKNHLAQTDVETGKLGWERVGVGRRQRGCGLR